MHSLSQFEIPRRSLHCYHQGEKLLPGMDIYSLLVEAETQPLIRQDFCSVCWAQVQKEKEVLNGTLRTYWKSKIEQHKSSKDSSRTERALALLQELYQVSGSQVQEAEIFVLCLFLSHARQLALRQEFQKDETAYQLYEILQLEKFLTIKKVQLSPKQIEDLQKSLAYQLQPSVINAT